MSKGKLQQFEELNRMPNVFQNFDYEKASLINYKGEVVDTKSNWHKIFGNHNPIVLELACGKGEYSIGLSQIHPDKNFVGVDLKGNRIWHGAKKSLEINNIRFLRTRIEQLEHYFDKNEVDEIWIIFPDPHLKDKREKHRLTAINFLNRYKQYAKPDCRINLKTDSSNLYFYTLEVIEKEGLTIFQNISNVYSAFKVSEELNIKTYYEGKHLEDKRIIKYLQFGLNV